MHEDATFLRQAIDLAVASVSELGGGPFGAVVVRDGLVVGTGWNQVVANRDPSAHAEVMAIRAACRKLDTFHLVGCTLYASSEPCPMCLSAAYWARIARIVFANPRAAADKAGFCDDELYEELRRPHAERRMPTIQISVPDADEALQLWHDVPENWRY
ncbi:MAG: nucleoside deaminase [Azospira sp.]|nr:nucleoside deaminase [Azospira sp.]